LIDIATKKQERGMISDWNAWQSKQQKVKTSRQKKTPNDPADVLEMTQKALTKLDTLDTTAWSDDDRERLRVALGALNEKIAGLLNPNPGPA
jgi:hypothetical protein